METEKQELAVLKEDISSLKQDVEELSKMPCPFQTAYNNFQRKEELTEECSSLQQRIDGLKAEWARRTQMVSEVDTVWNVFSHFPVIKEFIFEVGQLLKRPFGKAQLSEVVDVFREKVLGMNTPEHERTRGRSR